MRQDNRIRNGVLYALLFAVMAALYLWRLGDYPSGLLDDEVFTAHTARNLASHGRDLFGRFMPLYLRRNDFTEFWYPPIQTYAIALLLKLLPFSESTIRWPIASAAMVDVVLMFWIARTLVDNTLLAVTAAALLALTPTHFIYGRYAVDNQMPLPFLLGWLLCVVTYVRSRRRPLLLAAGTLLGLGLFSYTGAPPMMLLCLILTFGVLLYLHEGQQVYLMAVAGFALAASVYVAWFVRHPSAFRVTFLHYQNNQPSVSAEASGMKLVSAYLRIGDMISLYGRFWDPRHLFFAGPEQNFNPFKTDNIGIFLLPMAGVFCIGLVSIIRGKVRIPDAILLLGGLLAAPIPAALVSPSAAVGGHAIWRALTVVPFGILLAVLGLDYLYKAETYRERNVLCVIAWLIPAALLAAFIDYQSPGFPDVRAMLRAATAVLVVIGVAMGLQLRGDFAASRRMSQLVSATLFTLVAVQCGYFYIDYFGRAAGGNPFRRALERVIEDASNRAAPALYMGLTGGFDYERWRFYLAKHGRTDLLARTVLRTGNVDADLERVRTLPPGSIVMITLGWAQMDRAVDKMAVEGELKVDQAIHRVVDNGAMYLILEKQR